MHLIQAYGFFLLVPVLFVVVGVCMWIYVISGLITGGPRALHEPGAPYLYDRLYYLLYGIGMVGWTWGMLSFVSLGNDSSPTGFMLGWGIGAVAMGSLFLLRGDMFIRAAQYRAKYGNWLVRLFYQKQDFSRVSPIMCKLFAFLFIIAGTGVLAFNLPHLGQAVVDAQTGMARLIHAITTA